MKPAIGPLALALVFLMVIAGFCVAHYEPPFTQPLILELRLRGAAPNVGEPIVATGHHGAGDLLFLRWIDRQHVVFAFDSWGSPLVVGSKPMPVVPDRPIQVRAHLPNLEFTGDRIESDTRRLVVECGNVAVLDAVVHYHASDRAEIRFAENSIGSSYSESQLGGTIATANGTPLRGAAGRRLSVPERISSWVEHEPRQVVATFGIALLTFAAAKRLSARQPIGRAIIQALQHTWQRHRTATVAISISTLCFAGAVTYGTFRLFDREPYGVFYDYQARSLLSGRLDVPEEAIGGEAFIAHGKFYGYFGPTPAVLRMPFAVFEVGVGRLARSFMLLYFVAALIAAYALLRDFSRIVGKSEPSRWATATLLINAGLGSTLFFLGGRAMMYHEAILCGATFALWSGWCALRQLQTPSRRWWTTALACGLAAMQTRPSVGLFSLALLGAVVVVQGMRGRDPNGKSGNGSPARSRTRALAITGFTIAAMLSFNAIGYLKFGTFEGAPLRLSRPYTPQRLAAVEGKSFHAVNLRFGSYAYLVRNNLHLEPKFPYLTIGSSDTGSRFPEAKVDLPDFMVALPWGIPALFVAATAGALFAAMRYRALRLPIAINYIAVVPMALALLMAIAIAQRYTGDFCPWLIVSAAAGIAALDVSPGASRPIVRASLLMLTGVSVFITITLTLDYQANWAPNMPESVTRRYQEAFHRIDAVLGSRR